MRRLGLMCLCLLSATTLGGCGARSAEGPPQIRYGQSACTTCRMLISEERFAASLVMADDAVEVFDSVECLVRRLGRDQPGSLKQVWVHEYEGPEWLDAHRAFFVHSAEVQTPMGDGLVALGTEEAARTLAAQTHGQVMRLDALHRVITE